MKSIINRLLRALLDAIVAFRPIELLLTFIVSLLRVMDSGVESMLNSVQRVPAIETGLLGLSDHLFSLQAIFPRGKGTSFKGDGLVLDASTAK